MKIKVGDNILQYEKEILAFNRCPGMATAALLNDGDSETIVYNTEGYVSFNDYKFDDLDHFLATIYSVVIAIGDCEDYLLNARKLLLTGQTIFINGRTNEICLTFGDPSERNLVDKFLDFLTSQQGVRILGLSSAIDQIVKKIYLENPRVKNLLRIIEETRREWNYIQPS